MASSPTEVVNIALAEIGAQASISSFTEGSAESNAAGLLYTPKIQALHRAAHWNCARFQATLTLLKAAQGTPENPDGTTLDQPPIPWLYEYSYPADCLKARFIVPIDNANQGGTTVPLTTAPMATLPLVLTMPPPKFVVATDLNSQGQNIRVILTEKRAAQLVYTRDYSAEPGMWDPQFLGAATSFLGTWFVNALTRNQALFRDTAGIAKDIIAQARVSDGNEGIVDQNREASWITARGSGRAWTATGYYVGWDSIGFPSGIAF